MAKRNSRRVALLFGLLLVVAGIGAARWWQATQRQKWLQTATIDELAAAASRDESDVAIFERLGAKARELEQWPRAVKAFQHACELAPDRVENWVGWARTTYELAGFRAADAILTRYIDTHPKESKAYLERAALRRVAKRTEMAWGDADKAARLAPDSGEAWALRGDLSLDQGIAGEGEASFVKARALMPKSPWPCVGLYQAYIAQKKNAEALAMAREITTRFPNVVEGNLYLGEAMIETAQGPADYDAARTVLRKALDASAQMQRMDQFAVLHLMGRTFFNQSRWREALTYFERGNAMIPDNPDLLFLLGRTYRALGDNAKAEATLAKHKQVYADVAKVRQFTARINDNPNDPIARLECARWYAARGIPMNAAVQYEEMIARGLDVETATRERKALEKNGTLP